jgi:hypothetical protein
MLGRKNNLHFFSSLTLFALWLCITVTSVEYIQGANSNPDEFLDFSVSHKVWILKPFQLLDLIAVHNFNLATIQLVRCESLDLPYPERVMSKEVSTTVLRC